MPNFAPELLSYRNKKPEVPGSERNATTHPPSQSARFEPAAAPAATSARRQSSVTERDPASQSPDCGLGFENRAGDCNRGRDLFRGSGGSASFLLRERRLPAED